MSEATEVFELRGGPPDRETFDDRIRELHAIGNVGEAVRATLAFERMKTARIIVRETMSEPLRQYPDAVAALVAAVFEALQAP